MVEKQAEEYIDAPPDGSVLFAICASGLKWKDALGELIDNALDAGATRVSIEFGPPRSHGTSAYMVVSDDGIGCNDPIAMIQLGKREQKKTTKLGRYGIGAKDAMLWIGGQTSDVHVDTVFGPKLKTLRVVWRDYAKAWRVPARALVESDATPGVCGTRVTVTPVARRVPEGADWRALVAELSYVYSPAIKSGKQIVVRSKVRGSEPELLRRYEPPSMSEHVDVRVDVGGKGARVYVGIVKDGEPNPYRGITYTHGFRVIRRASGDGCGGCDFSRVFGVVELDRSWELTKNKDDISVHGDELYAAVFSACSDLLRKAESIGQTASFEALTKEAEALLNGNLLGDPDAKAKRDDGGKKGTVKPTGKGKKHSRARQTQDGATFARERYGALRIRYQNFGDDQRIGSHNSGIVFLSESHPWVKRIRDSRNSEALAQLALTLFLDDIQNEEISGQRRIARLFDGASDIGRAMGCALAKSVLIDGESSSQKAAE